MQKQYQVHDGFCDHQQVEPQISIGQEIAGTEKDKHNPNDNNLYLAPQQQPIMMTLKPHQSSIEPQMQIEHIPSLNITETTKVDAESDQNMNSNGPQSQENQQSSFTTEETPKFRSEANDSSLFEGDEGDSDDSNDKEAMQDEILKGSKSESIPMTRNRLPYFGQSLAKDNVIQEEYNDKNHDKEQAQQCQKYSSPPLHPSSSRCKNRVQFLRQLLSAQKIKNGSVSQFPSPSLSPYPLPPHTIISEFNSDQNPATIIQNQRKQQPSLIIEKQHSQQTERKQSKPQSESDHDANGGEQAIIVEEYDEEYNVDSEGSGERDNEGEGEVVIERIQAEQKGTEEQKIQEEGKHQSENEGKQPEQLPILSGSKYIYPNPNRDTSPIKKKQKKQQHSSLTSQPQVKVQLEPCLKTIVEKIPADEQPSVKLLPTSKKQQAKNKKEELKAEQKSPNYKRRHGDSSSQSSSSAPPIVPAFVDVKCCPCAKQNIDKDAVCVNLNEFENNRFLCEQCSYKQAYIVPFPLLNIQEAISLYERKPVSDSGYEAGESKEEFQEEGERYDKKIEAEDGSGMGVEPVTLIKPRQYKDLSNSNSNNSSNSYIQQYSSSQSNSNSNSNSSSNTKYNSHSNPSSQSSSQQENRKYRYELEWKGRGQGSGSEEQGGHPSKLNEFTSNVMTNYLQRNLYHPKDYEKLLSFIKGKYKETLDVINDYETMVLENISNWKRKVVIQFEAVLGTFQDERLKKFLRKVDYEDKMIKRWHKQSKEREEHFEYLKRLKTVKQANGFKEQPGVKGQHVNPQINSEHRNPPVMHSLLMFVESLLLSGTRNLNNIPSLMTSCNGFSEAVEILLNLEMKETNRRYSFIGEKLSTCGIDSLYDEEMIHNGVIDNKIEKPAMYETEIKPEDSKYGNWSLEKNVDLTDCFDRVEIQPDLPDQKYKAIYMRRIKQNPDDGHDHSHEGKTQIQRQAKINSKDGNGGLIAKEESKLEVGMMNPPQRVKDDGCQQKSSNVRSKYNENTPNQQENRNFSHQTPATTFQQNEVISQTNSNEVHSGLNQGQQSQEKPVVEVEQLILSQTAKSSGLCLSKQTESKKIPSKGGNTANNRSQIPPQSCSRKIETETVIQLSNQSNQKKSSKKRQRISVLQNDQSSDKSQPQNKTPQSREQISRKSRQLILNGIKKSLKLKKQKNTAKNISRVLPELQQVDMEQKIEQYNKIMVSKITEIENLQKDDYDEEGKENEKQQGGKNLKTFKQEKYLHEDKYEDEGQGEEDIRKMQIADSKMKMKMKNNKSMHEPVEINSSSSSDSDYNQYSGKKSPETPYPSTKKLTEYEKDRNRFVPTLELTYHNFGSFPPPNVYLKSVGTLIMKYCPKDADPQNLLKSMKCLTQLENLIIEEKVLASKDIFILIADWFPKLRSLMIRCENGFDHEMDRHLYENMGLLTTLEVFGYVSSFQKANPGDSSNF